MTIDHAEHGLSHWVALFLERTVVGHCWHTAIEGGTWLSGATQQARMNAETKRSARGIKPSHLDWYLWQKSTGQFTQFELKVKGRKIRVGQDQTMVALRRNQIPTAVCETVPEVCAFLRDAGFVLHGNAVNIAAELHERYLGERRIAEVAKETGVSRKTVRRVVARKNAMTWILPG